MTQCCLEQEAQRFNTLLQVTHSVLQSLSHCTNLLFWIVLYCIVLVYCIVVWVTFVKLQQTLKWRVWRCGAVSGAGGVRWWVTDNENACFHHHVSVAWTIAAYPLHYTSLHFSSLHYVDEATAGCVGQALKDLLLQLLTDRTWRMNDWMSLITGGLDDWLMWQWCVHFPRPSAYLTSSSTSTSSSGLAHLPTTTQLQYPIIHPVVFLSFFCCAATNTWRHQWYEKTKWYLTILQTDNTQPSEWDRNYLRIKLLL